MTIGEQIHREREKALSALLEVQGLSLHRQRGLYQIEDGNGLPVTELVTLAEIIKVVMEWQEKKKNVD